MGGGEGVRAAELDFIQCDVAASMIDTQDCDLIIFDPENHCSATLEANTSRVAFAVDHCPSVRKDVEPLQEHSQLADIVSRNPLACFSQKVIKEFIDIGHRRRRKNDAVLHPRSLAFFVALSI